MKDQPDGANHRGRRRGAGPGPVQHWSSETGNDNPSVRATRWWPLLLIGAVAVVVVAVVLHPQTPLATPTPTPVPPPSPSTASSHSRTESAPRPSEPPLLTDPAPTTPSTLEVGHPVLGVTAGWELFARGNDNSVTRIELAKGRVTRTAVPGLGSGGPVSFLAGPDRAIIRPLDFVSGFVVRDGHAATGLVGALDHGGRVIVGPDSTHIWADTAANGSPDVMTLTDWNGNATTTSFPVPKSWVGISATSDGAGGLLFTGRDGNTYQTYPGRPQLLTAGTLLARGLSGYLVSECAAGKCLTSVIDRLTSKRRTLATSSAIQSGELGLISPDGKTAAVVEAAKVGSDAGRLALIDLVSGAQRGLGAGLSASSMVWSPDSRWLFIATGTGRVVVIDANTGQVGGLGLPLSFIEQLAIRATPKAASTAALTSLPTGAAAAATCLHPDAVASTNRAVPVGQPGTPRLGPLGLHPYPYLVGSPTKLIVNAEHSMAQPAVIRGYRCSDRRVLRFDFSHQVETLHPNPPYSEQQLQTLGEPLVNLTALPAGAEVGGYALFSSLGQWAITLTQSGTIVGLLRIEVTTAAAR